MPEGARVDRLRLPPRRRVRRARQEAAVRVPAQLGARRAARAARLRAVARPLSTALIAFRPSAAHPRDPRRRHRRRNHRRRRQRRQQRVLDGSRRGRRAQGARRAVDRSRGDGAGAGRAGRVRHHVRRPAAGALRDSRGGDGAGPPDIGGAHRSRATRNAWRWPRRGSSRRSRFRRSAPASAGFALDECARVMIEAIRAHARPATLAAPGAPRAVRPAGLSRVRGSRRRAARPAARRPARLSGVRVEHATTKSRRPEVTKKRHVRCFLRVLVSSRLRGSAGS